MSNSSWFVQCLGGVAGTPPPVWDMNTNDLQPCWRALLYIIFYSTLLITVTYNFGVIFGLKRPTATDVVGWARRQWLILLGLRLLLHVFLIGIFTTELVLTLRTDATRCDTEPTLCTVVLVLPLVLPILCFLCGALMDLQSCRLERRNVLLVPGQTTEILLWFPVFVLHIFDFRSALIMKREQLHAMWFCIIAIFCVQSGLFLTNIALLVMKRSIKRRRVVSSTYDRLGDDDEARGFVTADNTEKRLGKAQDGLGRGVLSLFLFLWVNPLIKLGSTQPLQTYEQLFELPDDLQSSQEVEVLADYLLERRANFASRIFLLRVLWKVYGWRWLWLGCVKLLFALLNYIPPLMLSGLVSYLEVVNGTDEEAKRRLNYFSGAYYAAGIVITSFTVGFVSVHYRFRISRLSLSLRGAIMDMVYGKLMRIRSCDLHVEMESSQIMNLIGTDCERVAENIMYIHQLWALPFQIGIALYLLYLQVGLAFIGGVVFAVLLLPINQFLASRITRLFESQMKEKDGRVKVLSECLASMRVIKLQAWEPYFQKLIEGIRVREMKSWWGIKYLDAFCVYFWATTPVLMSAVTFTIFVLSGNTLTAARTFTTITIFHLLLIPLNVIPWVLTGATETYVSIRRLQTYFKLNDLDFSAYYKTDLLPSSSSSTTTRAASSAALKRTLLKVDDMSFRWANPEHKSANDEKSADNCAVPDAGSDLPTTGSMAIVVPTQSAAVSPSSPLSPASKTPSPSQVLSCSPYAKSHIERARIDAGVASNTNVLSTPAEGDAEPSRANNVIALPAQISSSSSSAKPLTAAAIMPSLRHIAFELFEGELVGVVGRVGGGKTSFLMSILAEMHQHRRTLLGLSSRNEERSCVRISPSLLRDGFGVALQDAWIQQGTVKDNILFCTKAGFKSHNNNNTAAESSNFDAERYNKVIDACALRYDVEHALPHGDATIIGEHGITLSGGQRARINLARACYADKQVVLLDDPLSAVDPQVAEHIFNNCIRGLLKNKTVVLVTHHVDFLRAADRVIVMRHGRISKNGSPDAVLDPLLGEEEEDFPTARPVADDTTATSANENILVNRTKRRVSSEKIDKNKNNMQNEETRSAQTDTGDKNFPSVLQQQVDDEEERQYGVVRASVWKQYCRSAGWVVSFFVCFTIALQEVSYVSTDFWLAHWTSVSERDVPVHNNSVTWLRTSRDGRAGDNVWYYLRIYIGLAGVNSVCSIFRAFTFAYAGLKASRHMHDILLNTLLYATQLFYDFTPSGRIINRYGSDIGTIDDQLPFMVNILLAQISEILGTFTIICIGLPWFTLIVVPALPLYLWIQHLYRKTSREVKRIFTITRSPIYSWFTESISGLSTIRATRMTQRFHAQFRAMLNANQRAKYAEVAAGEWLNLRLQMFGAMLVSIVVILALVVRADAAIAGLTLSYALAIVSLFGALISTFVGTEQYMVSVERVMQYINGVVLENREDGVQPPDSWPDNGEIVFDSVRLRYRSDLPFVLNGVKLTCKPREKLALVGRTGAGKSSMLQALFRIVDLSDEGRILIDKVDISHIKLADLRSRLAVIPQNPMLFDATLRGNIDPLNLHDSEEVSRAIRQCLLEDVVRKLGGWQAVDTVKLGEGGSRLSMGERQLVCLARALVLKSKILCLDEATASVDLETDQRIQKVLRKAFQFSTVICIAHRIQTIRDYDRVAVMKDGHVVECDTPESLLSNPESYFYKLAFATHNFAKTTQNNILEE